MSKIKNIKIRYGTHLPDRAGTSIANLTDKISEFVRYINTLVFCGSVTAGEYEGFMRKVSNLVAGIPEHFDPRGTGTPLEERIASSNTVTIEATAPHAGELKLCAKFFTNGSSDLIAQIAVTIEPNTGKIIYVEA
jgi:hypothetical protein